ncbi:MAG: hypothetical protein HYS44_03890 [Candidatus Niyogibacteria bacterium]|nr:hypothetical protein [Candidatus Niyogibacteria bacterium]
MDYFEELRAQVSLQEMGDFLVKSGLSGSEKVLFLEATIVYLCQCPDEFIPEDQRKAGMERAEEVLRIVNSQPKVLAVYNDWKKRLAPPLPA